MKSQAYQKYLDSLLKKEYPHPVRFKFPRINKILEVLGNPQQKFKSIHVGGTAGKGSTATLIASILQEAGFKVGLYTSPYLEDLRERFQINGKYISNTDLVYITNLVKKASNLVSKTTRFGYPTYLETLVLIAFQYFALNKVEWAVVEVGLGGEGDTTNVLEPEVSVITNIALDHTELLGKTVSEIAKAKAGIIKPKIPLVTAVEKEALQIFKKKATKFRSPLVKVKDQQLKILKVRKSGTVFSYLPYPNLKLSLVGSFQAKNAATALEVIKILQKRFKISKLAIKSGLRKTKLKGRFEIFNNSILDSAHNPLEIAAFVETFLRIFPGKKCYLILGINPYNPTQEFVQRLKFICSKVVITQFDPSSDLQTPFKKLKLEFERKKIKAQIIKNPLLALRSAKRQKGPKEILAITGSVFLAGYLRRYLVDRKS